MHFPTLFNFSALFLAAFLTGCASPSAVDNAADGSNVAQHYKQAKTSLSKADYSKAIESYKNLTERFPTGPYTEQAHIDLMFAYFKNKQYETAIFSADRFIQLHPKHQHVDYAYYLRGLASFENSTLSIDTTLDKKPTKEKSKSIRQSFNYFSELIQHFPKSRYTPDAVTHMKEIRENLARYEVQVANYYQHQGAYLAAANRAKYVTTNYQGSQSIPDALAIMTYSYRKLGMSQLANDAYRELDLNHPDHIKTKELNKKE